MKHLVAFSSLFILALSVVPDGVEKCADDGFVFATVSNTEEYTVAAEVATGEFCRVVDRQVELGL